MLRLFIHLFYSYGLHELQLRLRNAAHFNFISGRCSGVGPLFALCQFKICLGRNGDTSLSESAKAILRKRVIRIREVEMLQHNGGGYNVHIRDARFEDTWMKL
ncbi:hypothetical protein BDN70DRAFT_915316, partial [Pholiota conissans]